MKPSKLKRRMRRRCTHGITPEFITWHMTHNKGVVVPWSLAKTGKALRVSTKDYLYFFGIPEDTNV